tara:strand:+ start:455 stop:886 length:432 start_codon:yes stop_codon:yes gene_type:complete
MKLIEPKTSEEYEKYYYLRWKVLRRPLLQPLKSERDDLENSSIHRMIVNEKNEPIAIGRLQINSDSNAQIRFMAVENKFQGMGLGSRVLYELEILAKKKQCKQIILHARENVLSFYLKKGYRVVNKSHNLFNKIQHWLMKKNI